MMAGPSGSAAHGTRVRATVHSRVVLFSLPHAHFFSTTPFSSNSHFSLHSELVSKAFHGRHGRAYLFENVYVVGWDELPSKMPKGLSPLCACPSP